MGLKVAIQMDPIDSIDIDADSTFLLAMEAQRRGHAIYHYRVDALTFDCYRVTARARRLTVRPAKGDHFSLGELETVDLGEMDIVLMRQDPPFDMAYITATHLLQRIHPETLVVNDPMHVRNAPEKLLATHFPQFMPPTIISRDLEMIKAFRDKHGDIIIKPLHGNGGVGVFHLRPDDENMNALFEMFMAASPEPLMIQAYLKEVRDGDKRIILVDGVAAGAVNRIPKTGEARSNLHVGGTAVKSVLSPADEKICQTIGPMLKEMGLIFVGIDVIGDYLTEINVTSPTGIQEINRFNGVKLESDLWDAFETRFAETRTA